MSISSGPARMPGKTSFWIRLRIKLDFRTDPACSNEASITEQRVIAHRAREVSSPALHISRVCVEPVKTLLIIAILPFHRTLLDAEEKMAAVFRPDELLFEGFIVG